MKKVFILIYLSGVCLYSRTQSPADCDGAEPICDTSYQVVTLVNDTNMVVSEINTVHSCLAYGEKRGRWYVLQSIANGDFGFTIIPNDTSYDFDWAVFDLTFNQCADIYSVPELEISCDFSGVGGSNGHTGPDGLSGVGHRAKIPVNGGTILYFYVSLNSNDSSKTQGYTIDFTASSVGFADCGQIMVPEATPNPIPQLKVYPQPSSEFVTFELAVNRISQIEIFSTVGQLLELIEPENNMAHYQRGQTPAGIYYYRIRTDSGDLLQGQLVWH